MVWNFLSKLFSKQKQKIFFCYNCDDELLDSNSSVEHIIANACGGRLKSKFLLCKKCNNFFGETVDSNFSNEINLIMNLLLIKRQRNKPKKIAGIIPETGESVVLETGGKVEYSFSKVNLDPNNNPDDFVIRARNMPEYKKIIENLKRKIPDLDEETMLKTVEITKGPLRISSELRVPGTWCYPGVNKIAINFFIYSGGKSLYIKHLLPLLDKNIFCTNVMVYYPNENLYKPKGREVSHIMKVVANPNLGIAYAYVELFNFYNFVVLLNNKYSGEYISKTYGYDLIKNKQINVKLKVNFNKSFFEEILKTTEIPQEAVTFRLQRLYEIAALRQKENTITVITNNILAKHFPNAPVIYPLPKDISVEIESEITKLDDTKIEISGLIEGKAPENRKDRDKWLFDNYNK